MGSWESDAAWWSTSWSISRMKAKLKHINQRNVNVKKRKQLQTTNDSLGEAVHGGKAGARTRQSLFTMRKVKWLKRLICLKISHTLTHINTYLSLSSAAISTAFGISLFSTKCPDLSAATKNHLFFFTNLLKWHRCQNHIYNHSVPLTQDLGSALWALHRG